MLLHAMVLNPIQNTQHVKEIALNVLYVSINNCNFTRFICLCLKGPGSSVAPGIAFPLLVSQHSSSFVFLYFYCYCGDIP